MHPYNGSVTHTTVRAKRLQGKDFTTPSPSRGGTRSWGLPALLAVVLLMKLVVLLQLRDHPLTAPDSGLDTTAYVELARRVVAGDLGLGPGLYYVSPLYIYVLAAVLAVFDSFTAARVLQIVLGTCTVWFIFRTARQWFGDRAAWIAAGLAAFTGLFTFYEVLILQSSIDAFLASAALWCLADAFRPGERAGSGDEVASGPRLVSGFSRKLLLAGAIFGLQTLNRPNVLIAAAGVALVMLIVTRRVRPAALLVAGLVAGMAPAAIRNAVVAGQFPFVSSHGGLNFYIGNSERATGFYTNVAGITPSIAGQARDARQVAERALGRTLTDAETSAYFFHLGWDWITRHPAQAAALFAKKLYYVFNAAHTALPHSYPFYARDEGTALRFYAVGPWLLIPLGLAGLLFVPVRGRRDGYLVWVSFVPAYAGAVALFFVAERYRLPLLVPLCVGAGALLGQVPLSLAPVYRPGTRTAVVAGAVLLMAVAANWPLNLSDGRWDEGLRIAQRYAILRQYDEADRWAARLEATNPPHPGAAHYALGSELLLLNEPDRARRHLEAAHRADPSRVRVEYAYGQALLRSGRAAEAVPHLRRGFDSGEEIPAGGFDLAEALQASGDLRGAAAVVQRIRPADTESVEAWLRLGRIAHQAREPAIAEPFFRRAVELRPDLASARQQYGLNLLVLGRVEEAARELTEAVRLDPRDPDSLSGLAYCELQLGRVADARAHAAAALAINPADPIAGGILRRGGS